jgi:hypothetical protein
LHGIDVSKVVATGAHTYDQWFDWAPSTTREEFCAKVGLDPERPYLLYVCSSRFIAPEEALSVDGWIKRLRESSDERLRDAGVLVRPHPANAGLWQHVDVVDPGRVTVYPSTGGTPTTDERKRDYYDSIYHCSGVVGINTSALIESAIVGRPVFTLLAPEYAETQEGTLHFAHLTGESGEGPLTVAHSWEEHEAQLAGALTGADGFVSRNAAFVEDFVRGAGNGRATTKLIDAIEALATRRPRPQRDVSATIVRAVVTPVMLFVSALYVLPAQLGFRMRRPVRQDRPAAGAPLRVLFVVEHLGLLIHFDDTVRGLLGRGHSVILALSRPQKSGRELKFNYAVEALSTGEFRLTLVKKIPHRSDWYTRISLRVRSAADYLHYLHPDLAGARYSRAKWRELAGLPWPFRFLERRETMPRWATRFALKTVSVFEDALPSAVEVERLFEKFEPDVMLVSPLVDRRPPQTDYIKTARALRVPSALLVTSWDNLTSKGLIRLKPDRVVVWNDKQVWEATELHGVEPGRVIRTGAQQFDRWFGRQPATTRHAFLARFGLPVDKPYVLFVGSTSQGQSPQREPEFVREWVKALRASTDPAVRELSVLVRPHPVNATGWLEDDMSDVDGVAVWTRDHLLPVQQQDRSDYFDGLFHSAALFGINSSAMIEAAIVGRPVHTVALPEFRPMQRDLLHFHYLLPEGGGFMREASDFEHHVELLADDLRDPEPSLLLQRRFVESFLRPQGLEQPATPVLLDAIEEVARVKLRPAPETLIRLYPIRAVVASIVLADRVRVGYHRGTETSMRWLSRRILRRAKGLDPESKRAALAASVGNWASARQTRAKNWLWDRKEAQREGILDGGADAWNDDPQRDAADGSRRGAKPKAEPARADSGKAAKPTKQAKPAKAPKSKQPKTAVATEEPADPWGDLVEATRR